MTERVNIGSILAVSMAIVGGGLVDFGGWVKGKLFNCTSLNMFSWLKRHQSWMLGTVIAGLMVGASSGCGELPTDIPLIHSYEAQLADYLSATGARMYGAYWCPYCANQKQLFGLAAERMPYVECDPQGLNSQTQLCQEKRIRVYPTWEIQGELHEGVQPLGVLATLSGFRARDE